MGSVGRNRKPDHIGESGRVGVSCSQLCSVVLSFKPVGRCDRGLNSTSSEIFRILTGEKLDLGIFSGVQSDSYRICIGRNSKPM